MSCLVVKVGGHALDTLEPGSPVLVDLAEDVSYERANGTDVVIVHGGGPQIRDLLARIGLESRFHDGLRVTDVTTMGYVAMALSHVNLLVTAALNHAGLAAVGLSGADATLLWSTSLGEPWQRAGSLPLVQTGVIEALWARGLTPVVSSVALDENGELLNVNADTAAGALAGALGADALVLLSDIDQLRTDADDPASGLDVVTRRQVQEMIATGSAREGMRPKMLAALDALEGGAGHILMANGTRRHALRDAISRSLPLTEVTA